MKERPILMTPENAQKCFDGTKTQTRRLLKHQPDKFHHIEYDPLKGWQYWWDVGSSGMPDIRQEYAPLKCPYGTVGDRLWIREALYRRDNVMTFVDGSEVTQDGLVMPAWGEKKTISSLRMPRWACRTVVEITEIRVQRVQEISEEDAIAEGVSQEPVISGSSFMMWRGLTPGNLYSRAVDAFRALWDSPGIHGAGAWERNDWVWALTFKKV